MHFLFLVFVVLHLVNTTKHQFNSIYHYYRKFPDKVSRMERERVDISDYFPIFLFCLLHRTVLCCVPPLVFCSKESEL